MPVNRAAAFHVRPSVAVPAPFSADASSFGILPPALSVGLSEPISGGCNFVRARGLTCPESLPLYCQS